MRHEKVETKPSVVSSKLSHLKDDRATTLANDSSHMQGTYHGNFQSDSPIVLARQAKPDKISVKFKIFKNSRYKEQETNVN